MTEQDRRKLTIKRIFDNLPAAERKEAVEIYGDDVIKWHEEYLKKQEAVIKAREDKLRKMGVNIDKLKEKMADYLAKRFGGEE